MKPDSLTSLDDAFLWPDRACAQWESHWIALHTFLWLNALTAEEFWKLLRRKHRYKEVREHEVVELMRNWEAARRAGDALSGKELPAHDYTSNYLYVTDTIRFCPECLTKGFHAELFQFRPVCRCPFHGCKLTTKCPACGGSIGRPELSCRSFKNPLGCVRCGAPFIPSDPATVLTRGFGEDTARLQYAQELFACTRQAQLTGFTRQCDPLWNTPESFRFLCQGISQSCGRTIIDPYWLEGERCALYVNLDRLEPRFIDEQSQEIAQLTEDAVAVLKSTGRYLSKVVRSSCGHRRTTVLPVEGRDYGWSGLNHFLVMHSDDCPCCALLDWWRCEFAKIIALHSEIRRYRSYGHSVFDRYGQYRQAFCLDPEILACALMSTFTAMANKLRAIICGDELAEPHYLATEPERGARSGSDGDDLSNGAVNLDVTRYTAGPAVVKFGKSAFCWTLSSARSAMDACIRVHKRKRPANPFLRASP